MCCTNKQVSFVSKIYILQIKTKWILFHKLKTKKKKYLPSKVVSVCTMLVNHLGENNFIVSI